MLLLPWMQYPVAIAAGLIAGSFANVLIARLPRDESVVKPRSRCPACRAPIRWYDNIPVLSYLVLRGRCRACRASIPLRYPVVELVTAGLFLASSMRFGFDWILVARDWPLLTMLVAIAFIDAAHRIVPDELSLGGLALGLITSWAVPGLGLVGSTVGAALGFGFFYGLAWVYEKRTGRMGLGGGDIKLMAMLGSFLGPVGVFSVILVSSITGSLAGLGIALIKGRGKEGVLGTAIPYGPFLVLGALYYYFLGDTTWLPFTIPM